jgi:hypothetical protein
MMFRVRSPNCEYALLSSTASGISIVINQAGLGFCGSHV